MLCFFKQVYYSCYSRKLPNVVAHAVHSIGLASLSGPQEGDSVVVIGLL